MTQVYMGAGAIDDRLAQLGLEESKLAEIVRRGYVAFASCTPNDPPLYPGFSAWATMVRGLREYLLPDWSRCDDNNYSLVINPSGTVAIAVATGDDATGRMETSPTTKSSKGPSTIDAVASNQQQLELPYIFDAAPPPAKEDLEEKRMTWILLVHRAPGEVRCEMSLPTSMGTDGRVDGWRERIILKSIPTDPDFVEITPPQSVQPDISVDVKRRA
ncbi:hypothetical protein AVKW3434_05585 [Acidovorax sp. SUPP3434]|uniref:hypothetical protein n=1 Tax=Acidovorax sp. SUPP3434 TaxID=2920880 RepID=UPI0023DE1AD2|nr:hypothetical protein [Acidovorax sp. SUPP3434]GKS98827.1 hypothetical protein AVKW3434_05585 [Acidovorax sp. SUPP3434]